MRAPLTRGKNWGSWSWVCGADFCHFPPPFPAIPYLKRSHFHFSKPRSSHCTPTWATEWDSVSRKKKQKTKNKKTKKQKNRSLQSLPVQTVDTSTTAFKPCGSLTYTWIFFHFCHPLDSKTNLSSSPPTSSSSGYSMQEWGEEPLWWATLWIVNIFSLWWLYFL